MNQFSSGQPSALASCRGARTLQGEACSLSSRRPAFRLDTQTPGLEGDTGCPPGGNTGPRAACWGWGGEHSTACLGQSPASAPVVCPGVQARSRGEAVAREPQGVGGPVPPCLMPLPASHSVCALCPILAPGPQWVAAFAERTPATVTAQLVWRPALPAPAHLPPPLPPARSICRPPPCGAREPIAAQRSTPVVSHAPRPPTSWQFVVVCRVLLSCKSPSRPVALRSEEGGCFFFFFSPLP